MVVMIIIIIIIIITGIEGEDRARRYQGLLGWSKIIAFKTYFNDNLLINFNMTVDDINRSEKKYG